MSLHAALPPCSAILPVPYAFSITGAVAGAAIFAATALANMYTCRLLLRGAVASATCDYEGLAEAVGGNKLRWAVEVGAASGGGGGCIAPCNGAW